MKTVYLGLGSNVGQREEMLQTAIDRLHSPDLRIQRVSSVYETEPQGRRNQRWFLNLVAEARTDLFPRQLLGRIAKIEQQLGRRRAASMAMARFSLRLLCPVKSARRRGRSPASNCASSSSGAAETIRWSAM